MQKVIFIAALFAASVVQAASSPAATQSWVRNYVATNLNVLATNTTYTSVVTTNAADEIAGSIEQVVTNGEFYIRGYGTEGSNDWVEIRGEYPDKLALMATNVTAHGLSEGITNGMLFVSTGDGFFVNAPANETIFATATNLTWSGLGSVVTNGIDTFIWKGGGVEGSDITYFGLVGTKVTKSVYNQLKPFDGSASSFSNFMRDVVRIAFAIILPSAMADQWKDVQFYNPNSKGNPPAAYDWTITDSKGNESTLFFDSETGGCINSDFALVGTKNTVNSVLENMISLASQVSLVFNDIYRIDAQMEEMSSNLNKIFADAWARMNTIEERLNEPTDSGDTTPVTIEKTIIEKTTEKIIVKENGREIVLALPTDGKSIGVTSDKRYQIKGFETRGTCEADMTRMVVDNTYDQRRDHYFIARKGEAGSGELHYVKFTGNAYDGKSLSQNTDHKMQIIGFDASADKKVPRKNGDGVEWKYAADVQGTEGSGEGYKIKFESESDSNVKFKVTEANGTITVKVGVYYK